MIHWVVKPFFFSTVGTLFGVLITGALICWRGLLGEVLRNLWNRRKGTNWKSRRAFNYLVIAGAILGAVAGFMWAITQATLGTWYGSVLAGMCVGAAVGIAATIVIICWNGDLWEVVQRNRDANEEAKGILQYLTGFGTVLGAVTGLLWAFVRQ